jgi:hypothetical protein
MMRRSFDFAMEWRLAVAFRSGLLGWVSRAAIVRFVLCRRISPG